MVFSSFCQKQTGFTVAVAALLFLTRFTQVEQQGIGLNDWSEEIAAALTPQDLARSRSQGRHLQVCST